MLIKLLEIMLETPLGVVIFLSGFVFFLLGVLPMDKIRITKTSFILSEPLPVLTRCVLAILGIIFMIVPAIICTSPTSTLTPTTTNTPTATSTHITTPTLSPTATSTPTPTSTPTSTVTPTGTPTPVCTYDAQVIDEGTYPDPAKVTLAPGQPVIREWTITSRSTCAWQEGLRWGFSGDGIDAPPFHSVEGVDVGDSTRIHELVYAPSTPGHYSGVWQMRDPSGIPFGDQSRIAMDVAIPELPASPPNCVNKALFIADITYPDDPQQGHIPIVAPRQRLHKAWSLRNNGTCGWNDEYSLVYVGGQELEGSDSAYVPITPGGECAVVVVTLVAPTEPGLYRTSWQMQAPSGRLFGDKIWILFEVVHQ